MSKKIISMTTHLPVEVAEHVVQQSLDREWSPSQYLRWLATRDLKRCEDDSYLMKKVTTKSTEPNELNERLEHTGA